MTNQPEPNDFEAMIDALASVGVVEFAVTFVDLQDEKRGYQEGLSSRAIREDLPKMLAWAARK